MEPLQAKQHGEGQTGAHHEATEPRQQSRNHRHQRQQQPPRSIQIRQTTDAKARESVAIKRYSNQSYSTNMHDAYVTLRDSRVGGATCAVLRRKKQPQEIEAGTTNRGKIDRKSVV